jgi:hypothetical protein
MASANRNQHWVPQFYLRYFATPETRDTRHLKIWAFPIKEGEEFVTGIRNVAAERDLYAFCDSEVDQRLSGLESTLGRIWPKLTRDRYPIDLGFKRAVGLFVATLYLRHPSELCRQQQRMSALAQLLESPQSIPQDHSGVRSFEFEGSTFEIPAGDFRKFRAMTGRNIKETWGESILEMTGEIAQQLISLPWTVLVSARPAFITTDHPVTLVNSGNKPPAILNSQTTIYLPLSPTRLVLINYKGRNEGSIVQIKNGQEAPFNYSIFRSAYRCAFSAWDSIKLLDQIVRMGDYIREEQRRIIRAKIDMIGGNAGRNDPCPCGSGKKFKHCCGSPKAHL